MRDFVCVIAGALAVMSFAPMQLRILAPLTLALLFVVLGDGSSYRRACFRGWLFGLGYFGLGVSWLQVSIHQFGLPVLAFSVSATVLFVAFVALFPALFALVASYFYRYGRGILLTLSIAGAWTCVEWIRSWVLTGFPWLTIGYSQTLGALDGYAPIVGVFGVSFVVALTAALLALVVISRMHKLWLALPLVIWGIGLGLREVPWTVPSSEPFSVALIQGNIPQEMKWSPEQRDATLKQYFQLSDPLWGQAKLMIWPETAVPALQTHARSVLDKLQSKAVQHGTDLLIGIPYQDLATGLYYNSALSIGSEPGVYHKRHLVPFGEYMPLKPILGPILDFLNIPMSDFSSGPRGASTLNVAHHIAGISICYEDVFGDEVIQALPEADILVNMSNDAWFGDSLAPHQHLQMAQMRAIESGRYMLRSTNTGVSAVIDTHGNVIARSPQFVAHALLAEVRGYQGMTPFARLGNTPIIAVVIALLIVTALRARNALVVA